MEKYYLVEKVKERFMIDAWNINVIKQKEGKLEMLSSKKIKPKEIGVKLSKKGEIFCEDNDYEIREISEKQANLTLESMKRNYGLWQSYMSSSEDEASSHLGGMGEMLY